MRTTDDFSGENDADGITSFVYKDSASGEGVMVDCGGSPAMKCDPDPIINEFLETHKIEHVVLSHAHLDHIRSLHLLGKGHVLHMSQLASRYVHREFKRYGKEPCFKERIFTPVEECFTAKDHLVVGPFKVVPLLVPHSISESCMLLIMNSKGRSALHQGDAKLKGMDWEEEVKVRKRMALIGEFPVDVMHVDNLNCHRSGFTPEESGVCGGLAKIIESTEGRIVIGVFASNLRRIKAVASVASKLYRRRVEFVGTGMRFAKELLKEQGARFPYRYNAAPVVFTSGCQGEQDSILWREAQGEETPLGLGKGDTVIFSSHKIPGNERYIADTVNSLVAKGCRVIVNNGEVRSLRLDPDQVEEAFTHVSGHGQRQDVETALDLVRPKAVIPSIRRGPQIRAFREICAARNIKILEPEDNCYVL